MRVSIIVPAYNAAETVGACITGCLAQTHSDCEIIVVDDGSTDATAQIVQQYPVRCLHQENKGPAAARNLGARAATGEIFAFTDSDCVPRPDWIARLLAGFADAKVVAVGGTYANANPQHRLSRFIHAEIQHRHGRFDGLVDFLGSFNVAVRREAFFACAGFDESFRAASAEDNDLSYRLAHHGQLKFVPDAIVAHHHPTKLTRYFNTQRRHGMWRVKLYTKHRNRIARGDQYASVGDLMRPSMAWCITGMFLLPLAGRADVLSYEIYLMLIAAAVALVLTYAWLSRWALQVILPQFSANGAWLTQLVFALWVLYGRDLARGLGMAQGLWHFIIRGKRGGTPQWLAHS